MSLQEQIESLKSTWGVVMAAVAAGPLALWTSDLHPPWPSSSAMVATTACAAAIWFSFSIQSLVDRPNVLKFFGTVSLAIGLILGVYYFSAFGRYVVSIEVPSQDGTTVQTPIVVGSEPRPGITMSNNTTRDLLLDNQLIAERIWTEESIRSAKETLLALFVSCFFFLTLGATIVTLSQRH